MKKVDPAKIVKIRCLERPLLHEKGEGEYILQFAHAPKEKFTHDIVSLKKEIKELWTYKSPTCEEILDRIQNFRKVFLNLLTGEVSI